MRINAAILLAAVLAVSVVSRAQTEEVVENILEDNRFFNLKLNKTKSIFNHTALLGRKGISHRGKCLLNKHCPAERPICLRKTLNLTKANTCVQCISDDDCPEAQQPCNTETNLCKEPSGGVPLVSVVIRYNGITLEGFTDADEAAVCSNLLALGGLTTQTGTCTLITTIPGSVIAIAEVRANGGSPSDFAIIERLTIALEVATTETLALLAAGISGNPTAQVPSVQQGISTPENELTVPTPPSAPLNVQAQFPADNLCVNAAKVTWEAPSSDGGATIATYAVACSSDTFSVAKTVSGSTLSTALGPLERGETYLCAVVAINAAGAGPTTITTNPFVATFPEECVPSAPLNPTSAPVDCQPLQRSISWEAPASAGGGPVISYLISCALGEITPSSVTEPNPADIIICATLTDKSNTLPTIAPDPVTLVVNAPDLTGVLGPLETCTVYTCTVTARNEFGFGPAANVAPFTITGNNNIVLGSNTVVPEGCA